MPQGKQRPLGRPQSISADVIEERALELFFAHGFAETSMSTVATACGVGRTTLFRYFPSKAAIIWAGFDRHLRRLAEILAEQPSDVPVMDAVRAAAVAAFDDSRDDKDLWMKRFSLLEETQELREGEAARWFAWERTVAAFVATRIGEHPQAVVPASVGGALQAAFVAVIRMWHRHQPTGGDLSALMDQELRPVCVALAPLLDGVGATTPMARGAECVRQRPSEPGCRDPQRGIRVDVITPAHSNPSGDES